LRWWAGALPGMVAFQGIDFPGEGGTLNGDGARNLDGDVRRADDFCGLTEGKQRVRRICPGVRGTAAENECANALCSACVSSRELPFGSGMHHLC
jgi:hypothetical protein